MALPMGREERKTFKIFLPVREHPEINYMGQQTVHKPTTTASSAGLP